MITALPTDAPKALILAPRGRDAAVAATLLREAGVASAICAELPDLCQMLGDEIWLVAITEEAIRTADLRSLARWIAAQPSWSDLPFILITDHGGGPERNPFAARLSEILGNVTFLERPFHPTTFLSQARTALKGRRRQYDARTRLEELREGEERLRRLNETLEQRVAERTEELQRAHQAVLQQITERERAESQLRHAQKMETIGQLTGGVAHDFNNLLMAVLGNLDLLRKRTTDQKSMRLIESALQGARRGAALTQRLLAFARRQDLQIGPVDLVALVNGISELLARSVGPDIDMRIELPHSLPPALADPNQVELALLNLVVNSRDAMPTGGTLTIKLETAEASPDTDLTPGSYLRLAVCDTGHGMDNETLKRAIEPFFSTKELGKGTGLGLSMIHGLAIQLGGTLRLSSKPGHGTQAELWLPEATNAPRVDIVPAPQSVVRAAPRSVILVVDDDALIAMSTVAMLEDLGHKVIEANSGAGALEILQSDQPVDLLITDHAMPKMTGVQLAEAARAIRPNLPILLATGYAELPHGMNSGLPRLSKPYQQDQLAAQIATLLLPTAKHPNVLN